ncbi:enterotoxin A family protein [Paraburkholderia aromaticivorans]|uniref:Heat-labile enterotoxin subunit alpha n=1 Tax=Paraburkholderia aromaticivorans TaxID=2026199 RepID=A0A248VJW2_9BURK|nr:enterotoxin A family protein [Paraburkholderia aromaticivorans]ASV99306.1 heat-labile enterotoxin subunit alpha [Paraburkholderia aromaticivorans]
MEISRTHAPAYVAEMRDPPNRNSPRADTVRRSQKRPSARVASQPRLAGTDPAPASTLSRIRRGGVLGTCGAQSEFRECRGGDALKETAESYQRFDQYDRRRTRGASGRGTCDGLVREAMRRIDRSDPLDPADGGNTPDLRSAVNRISIDADSRSAASRDMFDRIDLFQENGSALALRRYAQGRVDTFDETQDRAQRIATLMSRIHDGMQPGDIAHLRFDRLSTRDGSRHGGHAMLLEREADGRYTLFDPNNGAFVYRNEEAMTHALTGYLNSAYNERGFGLVPHSIEIHRAPQPRGRVAAPPQPLVPPAPSPEPYRSRLYAATARERNTSAQDLRSTTTSGPGAIADAGTGMAVDALVNVASGHVANLAGASADLGERLRNPPTRQAAIDEIHGLQAANRYSVVSTVPNHIRHEGQSNIRNAAQLADDLDQHFGHPYVRDNSLRGYDDDFVEIRFTSRANPADDGTTRARGSVACGDPAVIVQRINPSANYLNDAYQIYDPTAGVFSYRNFADMSSAISSRYGSEYPEEGDTDHASTTWFANLKRSRPVHGASQAEFVVAAESPINNVTLADIAEAHHVAVPPLTLPPEPDMGRLGMPREEVRKRSADTPQASPHTVLFRPSTVTPEALKAQGGFSMESTPLKDVSLAMHNFDVGADPSAVDSAGYLGTFERGSVARERLASGSNDGYIYRVAPTPNMVDVDGSLGAGARDPQTHEQAAMGRIDYTQIVGWQRMQDGRLQPFVANPDYRWDIYNQTRTAGAQPQLARYPVDSPVWNDKRHSPFMSRVSYDGKPAVPRPDQDPNRTQAEFYDHARSQVEYLAGRQARRLDYRGPLTLWGYGDARWQTKLYAGDKGDVYFDYSRRADVPGNTTQFVMGDDGRFHLAGDNNRVLRVDNSGYLYTGAAPSARTNRNGVFEYDGKHLIHAEDRKFLSVGKYSFYPYVTRENLGSRSEWGMTGFDGKPVTPPPINMHTFWSSTAGNRFQLYEFAKNPDSALPPGTTRFVTQVPGIERWDNLLDYVRKWTAKGVGKTAKWLADENAALLFKDGYCVVADGPSQLEARRLDGKLVWRVTIDPATHKARAQRLRALKSNYRIPGLTWSRISADEARNRQLQRMLKSHYDLRG